MSIKYQFQYTLNCIKPQGKLVYEYNPLYNFRLDTDTYLKDSEGHYLNAARDVLIKVHKTDNNLIWTGESYTVKDGNYAAYDLEDQEQNNWSSDLDWSHGFGIDASEHKFPLVFEEQGIIQDLITGVDNTEDALNFDLNHPVNIACQYAFDNSVNLILNDGKNIPRLINTRFTVQDNNTYIRVDRIGNVDTNLYDLSQFDSDTALQKRFTRIPKLEFLGVTANGQLSVGTYQIFIRLVDGDGNRTDVVAESGLIPIVIGTSGYPDTIRGGFEQEITDKAINILVSNLDPSYEYVHVSYVHFVGRSSTIPAEYVCELDTLTKITNGQATITLSENIKRGSESEANATIAELMRKQQIYATAEAQAICGTRLFLGNLTKKTPDFAKLKKLSLEFLPFYNRIDPVDLVGSLDYDYNGCNGKTGYYDINNCYSYVGYWPDEYYRFGVVYIMQDGTETDVFNIRGMVELPNIADIQVSANIYSPYYNDHSGDNAYTEAAKNNPYTNPKSSTFNIDDDTEIIKTDRLENGAGIVKFPKQELVSETETSNLAIYALVIKVSDNAMQELRKLGVIGFYLVRQKRIATVLGQAFTQGFNKYAGIPMLTQLSDGYTPKSQTQGVPKLLGNQSWVKDEGGFYKYPMYYAETFITAEGKLADDSLNPELIQVPYWDQDEDKQVPWLMPTETSNLAAYCPELVLQSNSVLDYLTGNKVTVAPITTPNDVVVASTNARHYHHCWNRCLKATPMEPSKVKAVAVLGDNGGTQKVMQGVTFRTACGHDTDLQYVSFLSKKVAEENLPHKSKFNTPKERRKSRLWLKVVLGSVAVAGMVVAAVISFGSLSPVAAAGVVAVCGAVSAAAGSTAGMIKDEVTDSGTGGLESGEISTALDNPYYGAKRATSSLAGQAVSFTNPQRAFITRGLYSSYIGITGASGIQAGQLINIYYPTHSMSSRHHYDKRLHDSSPYYAVTDRFQLTEPWTGDTEATDSLFTVFRGDSYIQPYTQRINRNFQDPEAPTNDIIVDPETWINNWNNDDRTNSEINRGDVNAVTLGMWITFPVRTSINLAFRDIDDDHLTEMARSSTPRVFYPYAEMDVNGHSKQDESHRYNSAFTKSVGALGHIQAKVSYSDTALHTTIAWSEQQTQSQVNGFRRFNFGNYKALTIKYGGIKKLITLGSNLLVVFEHGVGRIPVNPTYAVSTKDGEIAQKRPEVLGELIMLNDMFGTQWPESVCQTKNYVYGLDTVGKKIWRTDGQTFKIISDHTVQSFLIDNITLSERELTPIIGIRNVKTHYNANKQDVMFTYYDNTVGFEEVAWNLCFNEALDSWVTFYSWIPSYSANIYNQFFSYDRNSSKWIAKLARSISGDVLPEEQQTTSHQYDSEADGVCVDTVEIDKWQNF